MGDRYRLPEALGGGEVKVLHGFARLEDDGRVDVKMDGLSEVATVPYTWLTKVEPPLPPEPPDGAVVLAGDDPYQRDDKNAPPFDHEHRWSAHGEAHTWAEVCRTARREDDRDPVRLVPDPAAGVELPWRGKSHEGFSHVSVGDIAEYVAQNRHLVQVMVKTAGRAIGPELAPSTARDMAAALLAAADAAEGRP